MELSIFELVTIQAALDCKLEQLADNSGRFKRYPQKGAALVIMQLKTKVEKEIKIRSEIEPKN